MEYFKQALELVLDHEGGYSNHKDDKGGETNYGITKLQAVECGYHGDMKQIPMDVVERIYKKHYWDIMELDSVAEYSPELAIEMFESGVNVGTYWPQFWLQECINMLSGAKLITDGMVSKRTLVALKECTHELDKITLRKMLNCKQAARYMWICKNNKTQSVFIRGWFKRISL